MPASDLLYAAHVPAGKGPFPTVVLLHGWGADAHDLLGLAPLIHEGKALVLCPQGTVTLPIGGGQVGYGWFPLELEGPIDEAAVLGAADRLRRFIEECSERYPIDPQGPVIGGFSQGGGMALYLALTDPRRYAGLVSLSTYAPASLLVKVERSAAQEGLPVLLLHGTSDPRIEIEKARETREALRALGVSLMYREFEMGHEIRPEALRVVVRWLEDRAWNPEHQAARGRAPIGAGSTDPAAAAK